MDYKFDPATGDLILDGKGGFVLVDTAETALFEQVRHHFQAWPPRPNQGSRLHDLRAFTSGDTTAIEAEAVRTLRVLESAGRIDSVKARADRASTGRIHVETQCRDTKTGRTLKTRST